MKINSIRRILTEDFDKDNQALVAKLSYPINLLMESYTQITNKNISFADNISCQIKTVDVSVDGSGTPLQPLSFKSDLNSAPVGLLVVKAESSENPVVYPTSAPFIMYSLSKDFINIDKVLGLPANKKFSLTLISIG